MEESRSRDLRKGRRSEPGRSYLVTVTTWQRNPVFVDFPSTRAVINSMRYLHDHDYVESLCFVVMPDHLHWLFVLNERLPLSRTVHQLKSWSTRNIHKASNRQERIWQAGFHDRAIRRDEDVRKVARYIAANPLRAGLVGQIGDYPFWDSCWL